MNSLSTAQLIETLSVGGAENLALQIAGELHLRGHCSHLIVLRGKGPLSSRIHPGVTVHYLNMQPISSKNPIAFAKYIKSGQNRLAEIISTNKIDVLQTHLPGSNFWGLTLALKNMTKVIPTVHNNNEFRYSDDDSAFRVLLRKLAYYFVVRKGAATIAVSEAVKESLLAQLRGNDVLAQKIMAVTNGVSIPELISADQIILVREKFSVPDNTPLLVGVGRLDDQKNFKDLIAAADLMNRQGLKFHLIIAGEGPHRQALELAISEAGLADKVQLPGVVNSIPELFMAADLLVFPSLWEGLPLVLLEAMAAGLPTVGNRIDGLSEVLVDGEHGFLVTPGDVEAFAKAVTEALSQPDRLQQQGRKARELVIGKYNFDTMIDKIEGLYQKLVLLH